MVGWFTFTGYTLGFGWHFIVLARLGWDGKVSVTDRRLYP